MSEVFPSPKVWAPEDLFVGASAEFDRNIEESDVLAFARLSGDFNPLHVDADYARHTKFGGRIVHGAFQVGLASALIGMHLPGLRVLFGGANARFPSPLRYPARVKVRGEVVAWNAETRAGSLRVVIADAATLTTTAEMIVGFTLHEMQAPSAEPTPKPVAQGTTTDEGPLVVLTGASGGIGAEIARTLASQYSVLALFNRREPPERLDLVEAARIPLGSPGWETALESALAGRELYGIVHAAWPGMPRGGLLDADKDALALQLDFGAPQIIALARLLFDRVGERGGRIVVLGSTLGTRQPMLSTAAYSLGKALLEHSVRLLAPELARRGITINAVCPSLVPVGINAAVGERQLKLEAARSPMGRLCEAADVAGLVSYLLSKEAAFVSGQSIAVSGGQL